MASVSTLLSHGFENISESQYRQLASDLQTAASITRETVKNQADNADAARFSIKLNHLISIMVSLRWDFSRALLDAQANDAAKDLGTPESLLQANSVESYQISQCGLPGTVPNDESVETLPTPSVPQPNDSEPPVSKTDQASQNIATGRFLAEIYGVQVSDSEAQCLGAALDGVVDASSAQENADQYIKQFQKAFNLCGISDAQTTNS